MLRLAFQEKLQIIEVPVEKIREVPRIEVKVVEKIRHVPGPIEYIDIPQERIVEKPIYQTIEKVIEVPEIQVKKRFQLFPFDTGGLPGRAGSATVCSDAKERNAFLAPCLALVSS